jgi:hypothetical protein
MTHGPLPLYRTVLRTLLAAAGLWSAGSAMAQVTVFTYRTAESGADTRYYYDKVALQLALDKTVAKYGPYRLEGSPPMTVPRALNSVNENRYPNYFVKFSYQDRYAGSDMIYVRFPVDLGIVGYRVCFTNPAAQERLRQVTTLDELRQFTHGQGLQWADVEILRSNGFKVEEVASYENLFGMVAAGRFDLFCRGVNEVLDEVRTHASLAGLRVDDTMTLAYPLPRFFYTHASNRQAAQRIEEGLRLAYADGSLQKAWRINYGHSLDYARLDQRKVYRLANPTLKNIDFDFAQYFYDPFQDRRRAKKP